MRASETSGSATEMNPAHGVRLMLFRASTLPTKGAGRSPYGDR